MNIFGSLSAQASRAVQHICILTHKQPDAMAYTASSPAPAKKASKKGVKKTVAHPKYSSMIVTAISTLKERNGSSRQAILNYIVTIYKVDEKAATTHLKLALKHGVTSGALKQVKGAGASGSFRINKPDTEAKPRVASKKPAAKKVSAKKPADKKPAAKKPAAKKDTAKMALVKTPDSKKPAAKKVAISTPKKAAKKTTKN